MSTDISYKGESFWVSNQRLSTLIAFAIELGDGLAVSSEEKAFVQRLRDAKQSGELFPGCSFDLHERFPTVAAKRFWSHVFREVSQGVFLRRVGNHEIDTWQAAAICDSQLIARMLTNAVRAAEDAEGQTS